MLLWSIQDHISTLAAEPISESPGSGGSSVKHTSTVGGGNDSPSIRPRSFFHGHEDIVEDVQFCPSRYLWQSNLSPDICEAFKTS